jgi:hypothetical protein
MIVLISFGTTLALLRRAPPDLGSTPALRNPYGKEIYLSG